ncbi:transposase [Eionea flava]
MPRRPRFCPAGIPQHIIQRGNNRQACFASNQDMAAYAHWLHEASKKYKVSIHAWVFMTNHVHLLVTPETEQGVSKMMQYLGRYYVRYFNHTYQRSGTLWEGRFKSCLIEKGRYFLNCQRYIELNPVRASMVDDPADYFWSSYRANAFGKKIKLLSPHDLYLSLGETDKERQTNYRDLFKCQLPSNLIDDIRDTVNKGLILGSVKFKNEIESITQRSYQLTSRGPKPN